MAPTLPRAPPCRSCLPKSGIAAGRAGPADAGPLYDLTPAQTSLGKFAAGLVAADAVRRKGAPLNPDIGVFFQSLGITLLQGYGQSESGPVVSCNRPKAGIKMDTVGPPLPGVEVRIAEAVVSGDTLEQKVEQLARKIVEVTRAM